MAQSLSKEQQELIEEIGVFHEQRGMQPLMGRILGLLLVLEEAEATFDEIVAYLQVSKSAVSTALNFMQVKKLVVYRTKPGERKRYFYLTIQDWEKEIHTELREVVKIKGILEQVRISRGNTKPEVNESIKEICNFLDYFNSQIPKLFDTYKKMRNKD